MTTTAHLTLNHPLNDTLQNLQASFSWVKLYTKQRRTQKQT
jgi:hypothetical protein